MPQFEIFQLTGQVDCSRSNATRYRPVRACALFLDDRNIEQSAVGASRYTVLSCDLCSNAVGRQGVEMQHVVTEVLGVGNLALPGRPTAIKYHDRWLRIATATARYQDRKNNGCYRATHRLPLHRSSSTR